MKVHEYQAKEILSRYDVPVPRGGVASTAQEAARIATDLGGEAVIKAQVHAGGRGKAGGIRVVSSPEEAERAAAAMLGTNLVTLQTGPEGVPVRHVLVEEAVAIQQELYLGVAIDGAAKGAVVIASEAGGVEIEEVATHSPQKITRVTLDPMLGLQPYQARNLAYALNLESDLIRSFTTLVGNLYKVFVAHDCSLAEINPLVITADDRVLAVDAKLDFDDDALYRHTELQALHDQEQEDTLEAEARENDIQYVKLDGDVGCIVNGAGLAMATMDVAEAAGASPANFLDIGGSADEEKVARALTIILSDPRVERVLVNIFGGILRCDVAARGLLMAAEGMPHVLRPMVVRLLGTNSEEGRRILSESSLDITLVNDLNDAADAIKVTG